MKESNDQVLGRRTLLSSMGVAAVAGIAASAAAAPARAAQSESFTPPRHAKDAWLGELAGVHRVFIDSSTLPGGANALRYANNILATHVGDYEGQVSDYALVICFRHGSTPYAFDDAVWAKYGSLFIRDADPTPTTNPMNAATAANGQNSLASIREAGVKFAICSKATGVYSQMLARATGSTPEAVYAELVAGAIPESRFVPAGVIAATRSQEYGYSLLYSE
ncbi:MAG: hypothetical protein RLZZ385_1659 [Pseudomonadota bacterium]|jgi:intracellular sulfur oxidation DsrE/DsrF family protein